MYKLRYKASIDFDMSRKVGKQHRANIFIDDEHYESEWTTEEDALAILTYMRSQVDALIKSTPGATYIDNLKGK